MDLSAYEEIKKVEIESKQTSISFKELFKDCYAAAVDTGVKAPLVPVTHIDIYDDYVLGQSRYVSFLYMLLLFFMLFSNIKLLECKFGPLCNCNDGKKFDPEKCPFIYDAQYA